jgi:hypothetical protein
MQYYIIVNNTQTPCRTQSELNMTRDSEIIVILGAYLLGPIIWMLKSKFSAAKRWNCVVFTETSHNFKTRYLL